MTEATSPLLRRFRMVLWILVALVAVAATALFLFKPPARPLGLNGNSFSLQSTTGATFTQADLKGTPTLVFFGYTFCPDVCPTTLSEMTALRDELGLNPDDLRIVFATVDPARDTVDVLKNYLAAFGDGVIGLTGSEADVEAAKAAFGIYSKNGPDNGSGTYLVDHTATTFMLDKDGAFQGTIAYGEDTATAKAKVQRLTGR